MSAIAYSGFWFAVLKDRAGRTYKRSIYGYTEAQYWDLGRQLRSQGFTVEELSWRKTSSLTIDVFKNRQRIAVLEAVLRLVEVGKSPGSALYHVIDGFEDPAIRTRLEPARDVVRQTGSLTDALRVTGLMTPPVLAILEAGESSGSMKQSLVASLNYFQNQNEVWKRVSWKVGLVVFEIVSTLSLSWGIYASGREMVANAISQMGLTNAGPLLAQLDVAIAVNNIFLVLGGSFSLIAAALTLAYLAGGYGVRQVLDPLVLRLPLCRDLVEDNSFGVSFGVLSRILLSGGQLDKAIRTAQASAQVPAVRTYFAQVGKELTRGAQVAKAFNSDRLRYHEKVSLGSFSSLKQLGSIFEALAEVRQRSLASNLNKVVAAAGVYMGVCSVVAGWVLYQGYAILNSGIGQQVKQGTF